MGTTPYDGLDSRQSNFHCYVGQYSVKYGMLTMKCPLCGSEFTVRCKALLKLRKFCSKRCAGKNIRIVQDSLPRDHQPAWKGGKSNSREYVLIRTDPTKSGASAYKLEHRLVMEKHLGRSLSGTEVVHHKNGIKNDNRLENLVVIGASEHTLLHAVEKGKQPRIPKSCKVCDVVFKPHTQKQRFCSLQCYWKARKNFTTV